MHTVSECAHRGRRGNTEATDAHGAVDFRRAARAVWLKGDGVTERLLRWRDIRDLTQVSRWTIQRWEAQGIFPRRVPIGPNSVAWYESEVRGWLESRRGER